ncbi:MAG: hypothetical protein M1817_002720 [Caeruleum heppii]|nr:MAG: hypothetical protein M1817_002720 [Caeruleum heppii]
MASEISALPVNGTHSLNGAQYTGSAENGGYPSSSSAPAPGSFGAQNANVPASATSTMSANNKHNEIPKDEVGWYFVEQYYTNLSRSPDKLHLFFSKSSQFVWGVEAEKVAVNVGRSAISERIKELDFQDCKVRVLNVDSQSTFNNIVIQVIGEMSNKSAPHRKFVQTFVLAEQPNGYFVLNDIFRYINEEDEEDANGDELGPEGAGQGPSQLPTGRPDAEPKGLTSSTNSTQQQHDAEVVDKQLEQTLRKNDSRGKVQTAASSTDPKINGLNSEDAVDIQLADDAPVAAVTEKDEAGPTTSEVLRRAGDIEEPKPEKPQEPKPTPIVSPKPAAPAETQEPAQSKSTLPKTWANLVAGSKTQAPATPSSASSTSPAPPQQKSAEDGHAPVPTRTQAQGNSNAGWQTAGNDAARRQGRPQSVSGPGDKETVLAYVKNVTDRVPIDELRSALQKFGELAYYDVSRQKWQPIPIPLGANQSLLKNGDHAPVRMEVLRTTRAEEASEAAEDLTVGLAARAEEGFRRMAAVADTAQDEDAVATSLLGVVVALSRASDDDPPPDFLWESRSLIYDLKITTTTITTMVLFIWFAAAAKV